MQRGLVGWIAVIPLLQALSASAIEPDERGLVATLPSVGHHWVWVADMIFTSCPLWGLRTSMDMATPPVIR